MSPRGGTARADVRARANLRDDDGACTHAAPHARAQTQRVRVVIAMALPRVLLLLLPAAASLADSKDAPFLFPGLGVTISGRAPDWNKSKTRDGGWGQPDSCLLYTSPSPRDVEESRMPSSA